MKGVTVAGITELVADSVGEVMQLLRMGNRNRSTEPTAANKVSSRSHAVMQIFVEARERLANTSHTVRVGKLSLIDLAGSERASVTENRGLRMIEGANINRSLLALANCINALGEKGKKDNFVPYRDSKLTRLLKDSLGGHSRTVMIANLSPAEFSFEETHNTLKYVCVCLRCMKSACQTFTLRARSFPGVSACRMSPINGFTPSTTPHDGFQVRKPSQKHQDQNHAECTVGEVPHCAVSTDNCGSCLRATPLGFA